MTRGLLLLPLALLLGGCAGGDEAADETTTDPVTVTLPAFSTARVYWLRDGKVWPAAREVEASGDPGAAVLDELFAGPSDDDPAESETAIPDGTEAGDLAVEGGVARLTPSSALSGEARAQVVYTLTDVPGVDSVEIDGQSYTRADFEDQTPAILVESPLPFAEVTSPLRATGTANTFEATFQYELVDAEGEVVDENFVTATSGTGTRGTFDFTTGAFDTVAALRVFELSAKDGSRVNEIEIPLGTGS
jgi:Immunoglobulin-like domain of bacterial spore germination/Sporulation and spore germination